MRHGFGAAVGNGAARPALRARHCGTGGALRAWHAQQWQCVHACSSARVFGIELLRFAAVHLVAQVCSQTLKWLCGVPVLANERGGWVVLYGTWVLGLLDGLDRSQLNLDRRSRRPPAPSFFRIERGRRRGRQRLLVRDRANLVTVSLDKRDDSILVALLLQSESTLLPPHHACSRMRSGRCTPTIAARGGHGARRGKSVAPLVPWAEARRPSSPASPTNPLSRRQAIGAHAGRGIPGVCSSKLSFGAAAPSAQTNARSGQPPLERRMEQAGDDVKKEAPPASRSFDVSTCTWGNNTPGPCLVGVGISSAAVLVRAPTRARNPGAVTEYRVGVL
ncbi:hypothetical protein RJ55_07681 [Drechmeria coniospora]|nr:hypothetical protein RJ55_07681 [Drechmeria coniospora]